MKTSDFDFKFNEKLIATKPVSPRDSSRLLVLDKKSGEIEHRKFFNILEYLEKGDILVLNNTRVFPARLLGEKLETGGKIEVFLLNEIKNHRWKCLLKGRRLRPGSIINFKKLKCELVKDNQDGTWEVDFDKKGKELMIFIEKIGQVPLPPYIKREGKDERANDKKNYQTVFADENKAGSVAAPTAGLHFTKRLLKKIKDKGIQIEYITLHVGMGTFAPVKVDDIKKHKMHAEWAEIKKDVLTKILKTKKNGGKVIAVGTTSARSLEALVEIENHKSQITNQNAWVDIFIYPGYKFKVVDSLITNFHLPKSTLLMLVSALASKKNIDLAYKEAVQKKYRFYSYGDAMFIK